MRKAHRNLIESGLRGQGEKLYKTSYFPRSVLFSDEYAVICWLPFSCK